MKEKKTPLIDFRQVHFSYEHFPVFRGLSFKLPAGQTLGIAGASGCGKSTLLRLLAGTLDADKGEILYKGTEMSALRNPMLGGHPEIALVDQHHDLLPMLTVDENIGRQMRQRSSSASQKFLGQAHRGLGLGASKAKKAQVLSAGQKQRTSIAQALAQLPELLLLDEPFSNLDYPLKQQAMQYMQENHSNVTKVLVTHEPSDLLAWSDEVLVLRQGRRVQMASAFQVYHFPLNAYVGQLTGPLNVLTEKELDQLALPAEAGLSRPEHWYQTEEPGAGIPVEILGQRIFGYATLVEFRFRDIDRVFLALWPKQKAVQRGQKIHLDIKKPLL